MRMEGACPYFICHGATGQISSREPMLLHVGISQLQHLNVPIASSNRPVARRIFTNFETKVTNSHTVLVSAVL